MKADPGFSLWRAKPPIEGPAAYMLAVGSTAITATATYLSWPFLSRAPFFLLFLAVFVTSRWGTARAGYVATAIAAVVSFFSVMNFGPLEARLIGVAIFIAFSTATAYMSGQHRRFVNAIQASEAQFRATWEHAALGAAVINREGRVERINPALERILGHPPETWTGVAFDHFVHPDDVTEERVSFASLMKGTEPFYQREQRYKCADGRWLWARVIVSAIRSPVGRATGAILALEDITTRRQAEEDLRASEERLRRAQKMEAVGQLVAGVAHNFNNLLTITMGYADVLFDRHRNDALDRGDLEEIRKSTARGAVLTRQLLAFSRKKDVKSTLVDLNRVLGDLREILTRAIREDITLTVKTDPEAITILIDRNDFEQVILNLVINARDALPHGGSITVEVGAVEMGAPGLPANSGLAPGHYGRLRVTDDGTGMSPDVQTRLFEPFFTTKEVGQGTGLGLAFVYGVVKQHHGAITVNSAPGKGTTFDLYFPRMENPKPKAAAPVVPPERAGRRSEATVLLVEDEDAVRTVTTLMLKQAGYRVLSASSPGQAIALFNEHMDDISLLVTDVVMPEMHGPVLAGRLAERRPDLPVLFISGYSDAMPGIAMAAGKVSFLSKPFAPAMLVGAVADLLAAPV